MRLSLFLLITFYFTCFQVRSQNEFIIKKYDALLLIGNHFSPEYDSLLTANRKKKLQLLEKMDSIDIAFKNNMQKDSAFLVTYTELKDSLSKATVTFIVNDTINRYMNENNNKVLNSFLMKFKSEFPIYNEVQISGKNKNEDKIDITDKFIAYLEEML